MATLTSYWGGFGFCFVLVVPARRVFGFTDALFFIRHRRCDFGAFLSNVQLN
uniref:Uncharacterized protein n=1 Tax=Nymphaea colorata TaxID=210225 RepID=A0A5K0WII8_9MAGN